MTQHPKAEAARKAVAMIEAKRVDRDPSSDTPSNDARPGGAGSCPTPEEPSSDRGRWTDAEFAAEQVALARRQAEVARAEARELAAQLAEARAALEAARAAVHSPSPGVDDRRWSHPARDEGPDQRLVDGIVDATSAARRGAPRVVAEGRDPATRTRALPVVPATCGECRYISGDPWTCGHPGGEHEQVGHVAAPHDECPLRAKSGGA